jgi:hypothetical protein
MRDKEFEAIIIGSFLLTILGLVRMLTNEVTQVVVLLINSLTTIRERKEALKAVKTSKRVK